MVKRGCPKSTVRETLPLWYRGHDARQASPTVAVQVPQLLPRLYASADRLEYDGVHIQTITPRNVIRCAFAAGLIDDGEAWIDMLTDRNAMSHQYDFAVFEMVADKVHHQYLHLFAALWELLVEEETGS